MNGLRDSLGRVLASPGCIWTACSVIAIMATLSSDCLVAINFPNFFSSRLSDALLCVGLEGGGTDLRGLLPPGILHRKGRDARVAGRSSWVDGDWDGDGDWDRRCGDTKRLGRIFLGLVVGWKG